MRYRRPGDFPGMLWVRTSRLLVAIGLLLAGFVMTAAGAGIATWSPYVPVSGVSPQQPSPTTSSSTKTTTTTTKTTTTTAKTTSPVTSPARSPEISQTPGGVSGGAGGFPGNLRPRADDQQQIEFQLDPLIIKLTWAGGTTQLIALLTAVVELQAALVRAREMDD